MIDWTEVIIALCSLLITGVLLPLITTKWKTAKAEMSQSTQEIVDYWVEVGVRWAKQWLQSQSGETKKAEVLRFVSTKLAELKINVSADELDRIIEAIYEQVKAE